MHIREHWVYATKLAKITSCPRESIIEITSNHDNHLNQQHMRLIETRQYLLRITTTNWALQTATITFYI